MRAAIVCVMLIAACRGGDRDHGRAATAGSAATLAAPSSTAATGWPAIEALAAPEGASGPSADLERAIAIARANDDAWRDARNHDPPTPLAAYPHGPDATAALRAWVTASGGLPPLPALTELGAQTMATNAVGELAIDTATTDDFAGISAAIYLGNELFRAGRSFLEVQTGVMMVHRAERKLRALGHDMRPWPLRASDLARIVAAEALSSRRTMAYVATPAGRRDMVDRANALGSDAKQAVEAIAGKDVLAMIPSNDEAAAIMQFWLVALDGARRDEPAATTIARVHAAADHAPPLAQSNATEIAGLVEMLHHEIIESQSAR